MYTASMAAQVAISSKEVKVSAAPCFWANASARWALREYTAANSIPPASAAPAIKLSVIQLVPTMP